LKWSWPPSGLRNRMAVTALSPSLEGVTTETLALSIGLALALGVFPVYGCPTLLCLAAAIVLRLNLPAMQLVNALTTPLQFALAIPFRRLGDLFLPVASPANSSAMGAVHTQPWQWLGIIWTVAVHAIAGWFCVCVPLCVVLYLTLRYARRWLRLDQRTLPPANWLMQREPEKASR
jgi:hypothetical protein